MVGFCWGERAMEKSDIQFWEDFANMLGLLSEGLSDRLPEGFPDPSSDRDGYEDALRRAEMESRDRLSGMIRGLLRGEHPPEMRESDQLLFRYRIEWAMLVSQTWIRGGIRPPSLREALEASLVSSWEEQGCQEIWRIGVAEG